MPQVKQFTQLAFVDPTVPNVEFLSRNLQPNVAAILLTGSDAAPRQMARALAGREDIEAIHIIAHGRAGEVSFGSGLLSLETLDAHEADLAAIGRALDVDGEILLWSCNTGEGARGAAFVDGLSLATGVAVAASTGRIGTAALAAAGNSTCGRETRRCRR
jgi:hypothetical protein